MAATEIARCADRAWRGGRSTSSSSSSRRAAHFTEALRLLLDGVEPALRPRALDRARVPGRGHRRRRARRGSSSPSTSAAAFSKKAPDHAGTIARARRDLRKGPARSKSCSAAPAGARLRTRRSSAGCSCGSTRHASWSGSGESAATADRGAAQERRREPGARSLDRQPRGDPGARRRARGSLRALVEPGQARRSRRRLRAAARRSGHARASWPETTLGNVRQAHRRV